MGEQEIVGERACRQHAATVTVVGNVAYAQPAASQRGIGLLEGIVPERHGAALAMAQPRQSFRITSYNVCYTKLLRIPVN